MVKKGRTLVSEHSMRCVCAWDKKEMWERGNGRSVEKKLGEKEEGGKEGKGGEKGVSRERGSIKRKGCTNG